MNANTRSPNIEKDIEATLPRPEQAPAARPITRRVFIVGYLGVLMGAIVAAATATLAVFVYPSARANKRTAIPITLGQALDTLEEGAALQFAAPAASAFLMIDGGGVNKAGNPTYGGFITKVGGRVHALAITCPHLGCSYGFDQGNNRFLCPCHGSQFSLAGEVLHGPATSPLSHLAYRRGDQPDVLLIDGEIQ